MPEGDTIHKLASRLGAALTGHAVAALWLRERGRVDALTGHRVVEVGARGKHLLVALAPGEAERPDWVLHVHLGMHGRWARRRPGSPPSGTESVRVEVGESAWACTRAARAELLRAGALAQHPALSRLGPDLLAPSVDFERIVERARRREPRSAADLLLDQRIACGIGNVYKSEVLFLEGVHPLAPAALLTDRTLRGLYRRARLLMQRNLGGWRRITTRPVSERRPALRDEPRFFVYGRAGRPCQRCGARVRQARVGDAARATFWCPVCQRDRPEAPAGTPPAAADRPR